MKTCRYCFEFAARLLCLVVLLCFNLRTEAKPVPGDSVTQTGEPSHFQVDDRAAEVEVNANPAGVKVNAKPASLQVVAKPGTPAIPIFHPAVHVAPHFDAPPLIHHDPAMFYHGGFGPYGSFHFGHSTGWSYLGLKRNQFPSKKGKGSKTNEQNKERSHKSNIPHHPDATGSSTTKHHSNQKRQFIQASPLLQPSSYGSLLPLNVLPLQQSPLIAPYLPGALQSQAPAPNLQLNPYYKNALSTPPGAPLRIPQPQSPLDSGVSGGGGADITKFYQALLGQSAPLGPLGERGSALYALSNQMRSFQPAAGPLESRSNSLGYSGTPLTRQLPALLPMAGIGSLGTTGLPYAPSTLAPMFAAQPANPSLRDMLGGNQFLGPSLYFPHIARPVMMSRSRVPRAPVRKQKHKRSLDQQTNFNKRQMIINPNLLSSPLQHYRQFPPSVMQPFAGQQPSPLLARQQRPFMFPPTQSPAIGSVRSPIFRPVLPFAQSRSIASAQSPMISRAMPPLFSGSSFPSQFQASSYVSADGGFQERMPSIESLKANLVTPIEGLHPTARHFTSSYAPNLMSSLSPSRMRLPFRSLPAMASFGYRRRHHNSFFPYPRRLHFRHGPRYWRVPHWRKFHRRPLFRRRLQSHEKYDTDQSFNTRQPDRDNQDTGESVTQVGGYTVTGDKAEKGGEVLIDKQNVGFGPITVEAKTAEGLKHSREDDELKRSQIATREKQTIQPFITVNHPR